MKKEVVVLLLLGILLVSPLILAQEQPQTYSGFNRFVDNIKLFFSFGDSKVMLALEIREKEINSAITNIENGNDEVAEKNIKRARKKLQYVQKKVSKEVAEEVKSNINGMVYKINENKELLENFEGYLLEEEKTQLTAELVVEIEGKEGQTLKREIVKDNSTGENKVKIIIEGDGGEDIVKKDNASNEVKNATEGGDIEEEVEIVVSDEESKAEEIEKRIGEIDEEIVKWIIKKGDNTTDKSQTKDNEDVSPNPNIVDNNVAPGPQGIVGNQGYSDDEGHHGEIPDEDGGISGEIDED